VGVHNITAQFVGYGNIHDSVSNSLTITVPAPCVGGTTFSSTGYEPCTGCATCIYEAAPCLATSNRVCGVSCTQTSVDGNCGSGHSGVCCPRSGSALGPCCSAAGSCGNDLVSCGDTCQSPFGFCLQPSTPAPSLPPLQSGYCASGPTSSSGNFGVGSIYSEDALIDSTSACPPVAGVQELSSGPLYVFQSWSYRIRHEAAFCDNNVMTISGEGWADWNQNGHFDTNEKVWTYRTENSASYTATIVVPVDAVVGYTRLRLQIRQGLPLGGGPCDPFLYGGTKDLTLYVSNPNDLKVE